MAAPIGSDLEPTITGKPIRRNVRPLGFGGLLDVGRNIRQGIRRRRGMPGDVGGPKQGISQGGVQWEPAQNTVVGGDMGAGDFGPGGPAGGYDQVWVDYLAGLDPGSPEFSQGFAGYQAGSAPSEDVLSWMWERYYEKYPWLRPGAGAAADEIRDPGAFRTNDTPFDDWRDLPGNQAAIEEMRTRARVREEGRAKTEAEARTLARQQYEEGVASRIRRIYGDGPLADRIIAAGAFGQL